MGRLFKLQSRRFIRSPFFLTLVLCSLIYLWILSINLMDGTEYAMTGFDFSSVATSSAAGFLGNCTFLLFAVFMLLAYEYLRGNEACKIEESVNAIGGRGKSLWVQLLVLSSFAMGMVELQCISTLLSFVPQQK